MLTKEQIEYYEALSNELKEILNGIMEGLRVPNSEQNKLKQTSTETCGISAH